MARFPTFRELSIYTHPHGSSFGIFMIEKNYPRSLKYIAKYRIRICAEVRGVQVSYQSPYIVREAYLVN